MKNALLSGLYSDWQETDRPIYFPIIHFGLDMEKNNTDILNRHISLDNGGRRSGGDRRNYSYTLHIPERRNGNNRRCAEDRRRIPRTKANPRNWLSERPLLKLTRYSPVPQVISSFLLILK